MVYSGRIDLFLEFFYDKIYSFKGAIIMAEGLFSSIKAQFKSNADLQAEIDMLKKQLQEKQAELDTVKSQNRLLTNELKLRRGAGKVNLGDEAVKIWTDFSMRLSSLRRDPLETISGSIELSRLTVSYLLVPLLKLFDPENKLIKDVNVINSKLAKVLVGHLLSSYSMTCIDEGIDLAEASKSLQQTLNDMPEILNDPRAKGWMDTISELAKKIELDKRNVQITKTFTEKMQTNFMSKLVYLMIDCDMSNPEDEKAFKLLSYAITFYTYDYIRLMRGISEWACQDWRYLKNDLKYTEEHDLRRSEFRFNDPEYSSYTANGWYKYLKSIGASEEDVKFLPGGQNVGKALGPSDGKSLTIDQIIEKKRQERERPRLSNIGRSY